MVLDAGTDLVASIPLYGHSPFLYPPLAAVLGSVLGVLPGALWLETVLRIAVVSVGAWLVTRDQRAAVRVLAIVVAVTCVPVVQDLVYGNVDVWLAGAIALVCWRPDSRRTGVPLGLLLALFAKPQLLPFMLWMLCWRRQALAGTVATAAIATVAGVLAAGPVNYGQWLSYDLGQYSSLGAPFAGNESLQVLVGSAWPIVACGLVIALGLALWRLDKERALVWSLATGVLLLPYAAAYSLVPLLPAAKRLARVGPAVAVIAAPLTVFAPATGLIPLLAAQVPLARTRAIATAAIKTSLRIPWHLRWASAGRARPESAPTIPDRDPVAT